MKCAVRQGAIIRQGWAREPRRDRLITPSLLGMSDRPKRARRPTAAVIEAAEASAVLAPARSLRKRSRAASSGTKSGPLSESANQPAVNPRPKRSCQAKTPQSEEQRQDIQRRVAAVGPKVAAQKRKAAETTLRHNEMRARAQKKEEAGVRKLVAACAAKACLAVKASLRKERKDVGVAARARQQQAQEDAAFDAMMKHVAPSDLEGLTSTRDGLLTLLQLVANQLVSEQPQHAAALAPLVAATGEEAAVERYLDKVSKVFSSAFTAAMSLPPREHGQRRMTFAGTLARSTRELYDLFVALESTASESKLGLVHYRLQEAFKKQYISLNMPETELPKPLAEAASIDAEERGVVYYIAGFAMRKELLHAYKQEAALVPLLQSLLLSDGDAPLDEDARKYLAARELWGGLTRVSVGFARWLEAVEVQVRRYLSMDSLLNLRELAMESAASAVGRSEELITMFGELLPDETPEDIALRCRTRLLARYLHTRANSFRKEVMVAIQSHKNAAGLRSTLKASMGHDYSGKAKRASSATPVPFNGACLGLFTADALHSHLVKVATHNPAELSKNLTKPQMVALIVAYDCKRPGSKFKKDDVHSELIGAILGHEGFTHHDGELMKAPIPDRGAA